VKEFVKETEHTVQTQTFKTKVVTKSVNVYIYLTVSQHDRNRLRILMFF